MIPGADASLFNSTAALLGELSKIKSQSEHWLNVVETKDIPNNLKIDADRAVRELDNALTEVTAFFNAITA